MLSDARLKGEAQCTAFASLIADIHQPESIAEILMLPHGANTVNAGTVAQTCYLQLEGHMPLCITSPQLTSFGSTLGPRGEHTICKKVNAQSNGFGGMILGMTQHEQDHIICGSANLQTLTFKLVNARGQVVNLNGGHMSFSILFQPYG